jgi:hypothetical protein
MRSTVFLKKQELNSSETSYDRVKGLIGGVVKKASFSMVERGLVKKVTSAVWK